MPERRILDSTSFAALNDESQTAVRDLFDRIYQNGNPLGLKTLSIFMQPSSASVAPSVSERRALATRLDIYGSKLAATNEASFKFLNTTQKEALQEELLLTFYLLSTQYWLDNIEGRRQVQKGRAKQIFHCANLIQQLRGHTQPSSPEASLQQTIDRDYEKCLKYLGLTLVAPVLAEGINAIAKGDWSAVKNWAGSGKTTFVTDQMNDFNKYRLYWVWAGNLLNSVFKMLPEDFANRTQAQQVLADIAPVTGYISWVLYYARLGVQLLLILKHTIPGGWMSDDEKKIPAWERFTTQLNLRKFGVLNDIVWATANLACFFWLKGSGALGYLGNVATVGLLLMDSCLTIWRFLEEDTQHRKNVKKFTDDKALLREKINAAEKDGDQHELGRLQHHWDALNKAEAHCALEWKYKKYLLCKDMAYAIALMLAFAVVCAFVTPAGVFAPGALLIFGLVGAGLCFMLTAFNAVAGTTIEIAKAQESKELVLLESQGLLEKFKTEADPLVKKQLYLDIKQLMAESDYQTKVVNFKRIKLIHAFFIDILVPPLIFASLVFLPLGMGIPIIVTGILLAILSHFLLKYLEPQKSPLPDWNEGEYKALAELPEPKLEDFKDATGNLVGFFVKTKTPLVSCSQPVDDAFTDTPRLTQ